MSSRSSVKSAFENLRPTILREPTRSAVSPEAEARLLDTVPASRNSPEEPNDFVQRESSGLNAVANPDATRSTGTLLQKKKRERLLLVSFRMPQSLKERLEQAAKTHEINQTDLINEAIQINLERYI